MIDALTAKPTVLLIEDDDVSQEAVIRNFRKHNVGFPIVVADDGLEGLDILHGQHPTKTISEPIIVLLDLNMPRMNGFEFLERLRADEKLKRTIVFVLTTSSNDQDKATAYDNAIAGYMVKSQVDPQFQKLASLLSNYHQSISFP